MTNLGLAGEEEAKRKGWKKVFGGTIKGGKRVDREKSGKMKKADNSSRVRWGRDPVGNINGNLNGNGDAGGGSGGGKAGKGEEGFVGMGRDGVWISRKNFLKT